MSVFAYLLILARTWSDNPEWRECIDHLAREFILAQDHPARKYVAAEWTRLKEREERGRRAS